MEDDDAGLEPFDGIVNCWLALMPSGKENGCLRVLSGSHKLGQLEHAITNTEANMLFIGQTAKIEIDERDVADLELIEPGVLSTATEGSFPPFSIRDVAGDLG